MKEIEFLTIHCGDTIIFKFLKIFDFDFRRGKLKSVYILSRSTVTVCGKEEEEEEEKCFLLWLRIFLSVYATEFFL